MFRNWFYTLTTAPKPALRVTLGYAVSEMLQRKLRQVGTRQRTKTGVDFY